MIHKMYRELCDECGHSYRNCNCYIKGKEAQDAHECTHDDWKQSKSLGPQAFAVDPGIMYYIDSNGRMIPTKAQLKESKPQLKEKMWPLLIFSLGFTAGFVWAMLSMFASRL